MRNPMAQSSNHPAFRHCLDRRHGDHVATDGVSLASDLLTLGCHVGTHVDALAHISHDVSANPDRTPRRRAGAGSDSPPP